GTWCGRWCWSATTRSGTPRICSGRRCDWSASQAAARLWPPSCPASTHPPPTRSSPSSSAGRTRPRSISAVSYRAPSRRLMGDGEGGNEPVGVNEAHGKQIHFLPAEQGIDAGGEVTGWLDRKFHQAIGGAVHQPPPPAAVHASRSPDPGLGSLNGTDRPSWYVQLEGAHPNPDLIGVNLHTRYTRTSAEEKGVQPGSNSVQPGLAVADSEPLCVRRRDLAPSRLVLLDDRAPGGGKRLTRLRHALAGCCAALVLDRYLQRRAGVARIRQAWLPLPAYAASPSGARAGVVAWCPFAHAG